MGIRIATGIIQPRSGGAFLLSFVLHGLADHTHQSGAIPKPDQSGVVHGHAAAVGADREKLEGISG